MPLPAPDTVSLYGNREGVERAADQSHQSAGVAGLNLLVCFCGPCREVARLGPGKQPEYKECAGGHDSQKGAERGPCQGGALEYISVWTRARWDRSFFLAQRLRARACGEARG